MTSRSLIVVGLAVLTFAWIGPLPAWVPSSFAAHMTLHMLVVGIGAPAFAIGLAGWAGPATRLRLPGPLVAGVSLLDLAVVWGWHAPALHAASRGEPTVLAMEQTSFASVTLALWFLAFAGPPLLGALSLFMTSMHMTLLGVLLSLAPHPSFAGHGSHAGGFSGFSALEDQQLGGVVMLAVGGSVYLIGGLFLVARLLRPA